MSSNRSSNSRFKEDTLIYDHLVSLVTDHVIGDYSTYNID